MEENEGAVAVVADFVEVLGTALPPSARVD